MKPHQSLSVTGENNSDSNTVRVLAGDMTGEPRGSLAQPNSGNVMDLEHTTITWWRRPSAWWLLTAIPFTAMASSAKIAPRIEIYTVLACAVHKPDIAGEDISGRFGSQILGSAVSLLGYFHGHTKLGLDSFIGLNNEPGAVASLNASECASDPVVQAAVAKLIAVIAACAGVLSFLTTGFWGAYSDRHGRVRVMSISVVGLVLDDLNFILVTKYPRLVPGGYWFLVVGATIDGCLGGLTTGVAAIHTYLADTTDEHDRSRVLSLNVGLLFIGLAVGPTFGSFLIRTTGQVLSVFYGAIICTLLYLCFVWFIVPESVTEQQMIRARAKYTNDLRGDISERGRSTIAAFLLKFRLNTPDNIANRRRRDWSLTILALAYGCTISIMGSYQNKLQYAASEFGWSTEMIGYWLSLMSASRVVAMIFILPAVIQFFKRRSLNRISPAEYDPSEMTPLLEPLGDEPRSSSTLRTASIGRKVDSASFDLSLAKFCLLVDIVTFFFVAISRTGLQFTIFGVLGAFGLGANPAMQSVALALYTRRGGTEAGKLFGALSVIQAFSSQILSPALYSFVYASTVATFPRAIFFVTVITFIISFVLLLMVRLPDNAKQNDTLPITANPGGEANPSGTRTLAEE